MQRHMGSTNPRIPHHETQRTRSETFRTAAERLSPRPGAQAADSVYSAVVTSSPKAAMSRTARSASTLRFNVIPRDLSDAMKVE